MSETNDSELPNGDAGPEKEPNVIADAVADQEAESVNMHHLESKEEMFEDATEDIEENQFQEIEYGSQGNDTSSVAKEVEDGANFIARSQEERGNFAKEVANLRHQLKALCDKGSLLGDLGSREEILADDDNSVREMFSECLQLVKAASEEQKQSERTVRELHKQIEELGGKVQVDQNVEVVADRMIGLLGTVVNQEELVDYSVVGKIVNVERSTTLLVEQYRWILYEMDQLQQCLLEGGSSMVAQEEFGYGYVFAAARGEFLELKRREVEMAEKLGHLEDENKKLVEEVEKRKTLVENMNVEVGKLKAELEQERNRYANTKEKLSMAVTKGKALVQQRDSLKQTLAEKSSELEKCLVELQEKSNALESAEVSKEELVKQEGLIASLQETISQKNSILETFEDIFFQTSVPEELLSADVIARLKWLVNLVVSLQKMLSEKNEILVNLEELFYHTNVPEELKSMDIVERLKWLVNSVASLQAMLSEKAEILDKMEEIFSQVSVPLELQRADTSERLKWLVDERTAFKDNLLEFQKLKDTLTSIDLPQTVSASDLETQIGWLKDSADQAKGETDRLQDEIIRIEEAARNEISCLSASFLVELQEKEYLKTELDELACKYEEIIAKTHQTSSEKDQMVKMLREASGATTDILEGAYEINSDPALLITRCFEKIKDQNNTSSGTSPASAVCEVFERMKGILYIKYQEQTLYEELIEEDVLVRSELNKLSNELRAASLELTKVKEEKDTLQQDLERAEEKSALVREKLSLAVKKGKGLVQDRENLKLLLEEKNKDIEKLKLELQQKESIVAECREQITRLSTDLEQVPKLEADLVAMKDQRDQLQQFLSESNTMLQTVIESVDRIVLPVDSVFEEPVEKVKWLAGYVNECQQAKNLAEQELEKVNEETNMLSSKLAEALRTVKSFEDSLSDAQSHISQLADEKMEIEASKKNFEEDLQMAREEASTQSSNFNEALKAQKSLEDALSLAENNISLLVKEREEAQVSRAATEIELEKVREEVAAQSSKLTQADGTIKSLEDALSQAEANVSMLTKQNNLFKVENTNLESKVKKLKDEAATWAGKLADASTTIKSLEEALLKAVNDVSMLEDEKKAAEQEVSILNSKLRACMDELAGTSGSLKSRSMKLINHLSDLQVLMKNEDLLSIVKKYFEKEFENLKNMDLILKDITNHFADVGSELMASHLIMKEEVTKPFPRDSGNIDIEMNNDELNTADVDSISLYIKKTTDQFQLRDKRFADNFEGFFVLIDEMMEALLRKLRATKDAVIITSKQMESLKEEMKLMEMHNEEQEKTILILQEDRRDLLSACRNATRELQFEVKNSLLELSSISEFAKLNHVSTPEVIKLGLDETEHQQILDERTNVKMAENLLMAARKVQTLAKSFERTSDVAAATIEDLQNKLRNTKEASEKAIEEKATVQNRVSDLETDVESLEQLCEELRLKIRDYEGLEQKLQEKETQLSNLHGQLSMKEKEADDCLISTSQIKMLLDRIRMIEVPFADSETENVEPDSSADVKKLLYIVDSVTEWHHQVDVLSCEKLELQSSLTTHILENEHMKEEIGTYMRYKEELEKLKSELSELSLGIDKILDTLGANELAGESSGLPRVLPVLEKMIMALLLEAEKSKTQAQELQFKLLGSQKVVDELSTRVKSLEESIQSGTAQPEIVQERSIFEAPSLPSGSEISEIEDVGPVAKKTISPVPSAAHARTTRKGSTDHLALDIDLESTSLISNEQTDEDKGRMFKSLNTSGLIPKQGKLVADRIDGMWVSGSQVLMNRPRARLGLIAYWLVVHIWLLGTIL